MPVRSEEDRPRVDGVSDLVIAWTLGLERGLLLIIGGTEERGEEFTRGRYLRRRGSRLWRVC